MLREALAGESVTTSRAESTRSFSTRSTTFVNCAINCARFGSYVTVLRTFDVRMPRAHEVGSPTVVTDLLASARASSRSGVRRENRGSREAGDQTFSKYKERCASASPSEASRGRSDQMDRVATVARSASERTECVLYIHTYGSTECANAAQMQGMESTRAQIGANRFL